MAHGGGGLSLSPRERRAQARDRRTRSLALRRPHQGGSEHDRDVHDLDAKQHAHEYVADGGSALREPAAAAYAPVEHVGPVRLMRLRFAHQRLRATVRQVGKKLRPSLRVVVVRGLALLLVCSYLLARRDGARARRVSMRISR